MVTFYHITYLKEYNTFAEFVLNDEITVGESFNPFYNYLYTDDHHSRTVMAGGDPQRVHFSTELDALSKGLCNGYPDPTKLIPYLNRNFHDLYNLNRELILENIRIKNYPEMPSRLTCLWVVKSLEEASIWSSHFSGGENLKLITLESNNDPVKVDSKLIPLPHDSLKIKEEKAHAYWSGQESKTPMIEYLFQGKATVKEIKEVKIS